MKILLVEDDDLLGDAVRAGLRLNAYTVNWVMDGEAAWHAIKAETYDLIVLDLGLPRLSGAKVLQRLRRDNDSTPVLILTARDQVEDKVQGLDAGADDYLVKPFDLDELGARIRALIRRREGRSIATIRHRHVELVPATRAVRVNGERVALSRREYEVLHNLMVAPGRVISREALEQRLYSWGEEVESNAIQVHIHNLRKKLGKDFVRTIRGLGYVVA